MKKIFCIIFALILCAVLAMPGTAETITTPTNTTPTAPEVRRFTIDLTGIVEAVLALLAALITRRLIPWIKSKTDETQQGYLMALISILVHAAEQIYGAGNGEEKLDYVERQLRQRGYTADRARIEACVKQMTAETGVFLQALEGHTEGVDPDPESDEDDDEDTESE